MPRVRLWLAGTEPGRFGYNDERLIEACVAEGIIPTAHMRANAAWDLHHCYGDRGGEEEPCDPLARQLDANAVMVHPCTVLGGGMLVDRNPPGHQAAWESENFTMATSADVGMNNQDPLLGAIMHSASVVLRSCSSPVEASESKDTTAGVVAHLSKTITTINILHHCLGHIGEARLRRVMLIMGDNSQGQHLDNCTMCIQAKPMHVPVHLPSMVLFFMPTGVK